MPDQNENPNPSPSSDGQGASEIEALKAELATLKQQVVEAGQKHEPAPAPKEGDFNFDEFARTFAGGKPDEALDYMYEKKYGYRPSKALPALAAAVHHLSEREQIREAKDWMDDTPDYVKTDANAELLLKKVEELGLQPNAHGYRLAWNELKAEPEPKVKMRQVDENRPPTHVRGGRPARSDSRPKYSEEQLWNMPDDELDKLVGA